MRSCRRPYDVIPNIESDHNVLGGFSNGAHSIAAIVDANDRDLLSRFDHFILVEGGLSLANGENLAGKDVLVMYGGSTEGRHGYVVEALDAVYDRLLAGGANATRVIMEDTGHALPGKFYPRIAAWVHRVAGLPEPLADDAAP